MSRNRICAALLALGLGTALLLGPMGCDGKKAGQDARYPGPCADERDDGNDQSVDSRTTYEYNDQDLLARVATDADLDGIPDTVTLHEYDADGNLTQTGYDASPLDGVVERGYRQTHDNAGNVLTWAYYPDFSGPLSWQYSYTYDGNGYRLLTEHDQDGDGVVDSESTHSWNADHTLETVETDHGLDGVINEMATHSYNPDGLLLSVSKDSNNDGTQDYRSETVFNADGHPVTWSADLDGDGVTDQVATYTYNDRGNVLTYLFEAATGDAAVTYDYSCW